MLRLKQREWPRFTSTHLSISQEELGKSEYVAIDLEYNPVTSEPYMGGGSVVVNGTQKTFSAPWSDARHFYNRALDLGKPLAGHWISNADLPVLEKALARTIPDELVLDTLLLGFVDNMSVAKMSKEKSDDGDVRFTRGAGFLDLYSVASIYTNWPNWKTCLGPELCLHGTPCPQHNEIGYNGMDTHVLPEIVEGVKENMRLKAIPWSVYEHVRDMTSLFRRMREHGLLVDMPYVQELQAELAERKAKLFHQSEVIRFHKRTGKPLAKPGMEWNSPFNPQSPTQIVEWFGKRGHELKDTSKLYLSEQIDRVTATGDNLAREWLEKLVEWKDEGKDLSAWFNPEYFDSSGWAHPMWQIHGASTMRPSASSPSVYNIPKRGFAKELRRGLIAPDGYKMARADSKQIELRDMLWQAGVDPNDLGDDPFIWIISQAGGVFEELSSRTIDAYLKKPRNAAKRFTHAADYLEGFKLFDPAKLEMPGKKREIASGALRPIWNWTVGGKIVCFTGYNLAMTFFGEASWGKRKIANDVQEAFFKRFPQLRRLQMQKLAQIAEHSFAQSLTGARLDLYEDLESNCKDGIAFHGQHVATWFGQKGLLTFEREGYLPYLNIHDESAILLPESTPTRKVYEIMQIMTGPFEPLQGFTCPIDVMWGANYLDVVQIHPDGSTSIPKESGLYVDSD